MDFSVYIIQDRTKSNQDLFDKLAGDTSIGEHLVNDAVSTGNDLIGANIFDRYATTDALGENGIAIRGEMINSVKIKSEYTNKETYQNNTSQFNKFITTTITVTGNLYAPSLIEMKSESVKNKNMARVLAWANLSPKINLLNDHPEDDDVTDFGDEEKQLTAALQNTVYNANPHDAYYYRRVLVTVYSKTDTQFRAVLHDNVFVNSYKENYSDKNGNGTFTLVMTSISQSIFDVIVAGPTYKFGLQSVVSAVDAISSTAKNLSKKTDKVVETVDKVAGTDISDKVKNVTEKVDGVAKTADSAESDLFTLDNVTDNVVAQKDNFTTTPVQQNIDQATEYTDVYNTLTDDEKKTLANIPGFSDLDLDEKIKYMKKLKYTDTYNSLTDKQKEALEADSEFSQKTLDEKLEHVKELAYKNKELAYKNAYSALTDKQKEALKDDPDFSKKTLDEKLEYVKKLKESSK